MISDWISSDVCTPKTCRTEMIPFLNVVLDTICAWNMYTILNSGKKMPHIIAWKLWGKKWICLFLCDFQCATVSTCDRSCVLGYSYCAWSSQKVTVTVTASACHVRLSALFTMHVVHCLQCKISSTYRLKLEPDGQDWEGPLALEHIMETRP